MYYIFKIEKLLYTIKRKYIELHFGKDLKNARLPYRNVIEYEFF